MAENSKIEWTHHTFNPWIGCQKVGPGCDNCYAEEMMATRYGRVQWGPRAERSRTGAANWMKPLKWDREAAAAGERRRVFCASLADVFDSHSSISPAWRLSLWDLIRRTPNLDWMLLTKRPGNIAGMLPPDWNGGWPNVWLGCTVTNQAEADRDISKLMAVPAAVRFLSIEPLLGPIDLTVAWHEENALSSECWGDCTWCSEGHPPLHNCQRGRQTETNWDKGRSGIDLVIVGGESGSNARPMHPDWARDLRDHCKEEGVPFHFKQWGEWVSVSEVEGPGRHHKFPDGATVRRTGKVRAGRALDGTTWDQMPALTDRQLRDLIVGERGSA